MGLIANIFRVLLSPFRGAAALYLFLFLIFALIGAVVLLLGYSLGDADRWIDSQAGWIEIVATLLFRALCALVVPLCVGTIGLGIVRRLAPPRDAEDRPPGWGAMIAALVVGYFAWFGVVG
ncbi:MAG: hypothetical protein QOG13_145 [Sphingomonadales bacterium]|jgi:L-cystine uptake protein TcyP (sodium:dicarboxylate symporter family)|nr:hypothetical protein [Sphingomonadales bacterium]